MFLPGSEGDPNINEFQFNLVAPYPLTDRYNLINKFKFPIDTIPYVDGSSVKTETALNSINYSGFVTNANPMRLNNGLNVSLGLGPSISFDTENFSRANVNSGTSVGLSGIAMGQSKSFLGIASYQYNKGLDDVPETQFVQLVASYNWPNGYSVNMAPFLTKTEEEDWYIPFGLGVGKFFKIKNKVPVKLLANAYYNVSTPARLDN